MPYDYEKLEKFAGKEVRGPTGKGCFLPCPVCDTPIDVQRPTFGSLRRCPTCDARLGISDVRTYATMKVMPAQFSGPKKYRNKNHKPKCTKAETMAAAAAHCAPKKEVAPNAPPVGLAEEETTK